MALITENDEEALYFGLHRMLTEPKLREHYQEMAKKRGTAFRQDILSQATERFLADEMEAKNGGVGMGVNIYYYMVAAVLLFGLLLPQHGKQKEYT